MASLQALAAESRFPLFVLDPARWDGGVAFVAVVGREDVPGGLHTVQLLYSNADHDHGLLVSNIAARVATGPHARSKDRLGLHLEAFVRRFRTPDQRRWLPFGAVIRTKDFVSRERVLMVAGRERAVIWLTHGTLPLEVFDTAVREGSGVTDLVIAGWNQPVRDHARDLQPVTPLLAASFDDGAN